MLERERYVPRRISQLTAQLTEAPWPAGEGSPEDFRALTRLVAALFHTDYHEREQQVIDAWERMETDPDAAAEVAEELAHITERANFVPVDPASVTHPPPEESLIPLRLDAHLDDYAELHLYRRGTHREHFVLKRWGGLRARERTVTVDERIVASTRIRPPEWFEARGIEPAARGVQPGRASLKLFRDVPRADLQMLLPSTQVLFRRKDSLKVGGAALASGLLVLTTKLLPTIGLIFLLVAAALGLRRDTPRIDQESLVLLLGGVIALGMYVFRQWRKLQNRRIKYLKTLTENLYFRTLADGPGVFHTLYNEAEEQEVAEVALAVRFLLQAPDGLTPAELDERIETWLRDVCEVDVDFEIEDALDKCRTLGIVDADGAPRVRALPLVEALAVLDRRWDDRFRHSQVAG